MQLLGAQTRWTVSNIVGDCEALQISAEVEQLVDRLLAQGCYISAPGTQDRPSTGAGVGACTFKPILFPAGSLVSPYVIRSWMKPAGKFPYAYKVAKKCSRIIEEKIARVWCQKPRSVRSPCNLAAAHGAHASRLYETQKGCRSMRRRGFQLPGWWSHDCR